MVSRMSLVPDYAILVTSANRRATSVLFLETHHHAVPMFKRFRQFGPTLIFHRPMLIIVDMTPVSSSESHVLVEATDSKRMSARAEPARHCNRSPFRVNPGACFRKKPQNSRPDL